MARSDTDKKILFGAFVIGLAGTFFTSLSMPQTNSYYLYVVLFVIVYKLRIRLHRFTTQPHTAGRLISFVIFSAVWSLLLILFRGNPAYIGSILKSFLLETIFYLPYFLIWYYLIRLIPFTNLEVFYLAGLGRVLFEGVVTRSLYGPLFLSVNLGAATATVVFILNIITTFTLFGMLTMLPLAIIYPDRNQDQRHSIRQYIVGLIPGFISGLIFALWTEVLESII